MAALLSPGSQLGGYSIVRVLGAGGSGKVYLVQDAAGELAAMKLVDTTDEIAAQRLAREVAALQSLRHPAIPQIIDAELDARDTFVVFEYIDGMALSEHVQRFGALPVPELVEMAEAMIDALQAVHAAGVIHRDVTPANVMLSSTGPKLIDFGLAHREDDSRLTQEGLVSGTAGYVAPEVIDGDPPGSATDMWSLAATLAYARYGHAPFGLGSAAIRRTLAGDPDLPDAPGAATLAAALALDPRERPHLSAVVTAWQFGDEQLLPRTAVLDVGDDDAVPTTRVFAGAEEHDASPGFGTSFIDATMVDADMAPETDEVVGYSYTTPPESTPGLTLALALGVALAAVLAPVGVILVSYLAHVIGRATYYQAERFGQWRAESRGRQPGWFRGVWFLPYDLLRSLVSVLPALCSGLLLGGAVGGALWWLAHSQWSEVGPLWAGALALSAGSLAFSAGIRWGIGSADTREGTQRLVTAVAPVPFAQLLWAIVSILAGGLLLSAVVFDTWTRTWWPFPWQW